MEEEVGIVEHAEVGATGPCEGTRLEARCVERRQSCSAVQRRRGRTDDGVVVGVPLLQHLPLLVYVGDAFGERARRRLRLGKNAAFDPDEAKVRDVADVGEDGEGECEKAVGLRDDQVEVVLLDEDLSTRIARARQKAIR